MTRRGGHVLFWTVFAAGAAADLLSKHVVFRFLSRQREIGGYAPTHGFDVWPGVFSLFMRQNTGGPFSFFSGNNGILAGFVGLALIVILYLYLGAARERRMLLILALASVAGGAVGNLADRLHFGYVRDFLNVYLIGYPVFNIADVFITVGMALLIIELLRSPRSAPAADEPAEA